HTLQNLRIQLWFFNPLHHTAIPHGFTQLLSTVFQGLQFFFISPYKIFWLFLPKTSNYCQFMPINAAVASIAAERRHLSA
ncbi:hypothetical protein, partial [Acinetobacter baumannii]|uniref:hypothetical protein n=1 Tax=Acinetobacter baumannii TaxID=470 RepID=UPI00312C9952